MVAGEWCTGMCHCEETNVMTGITMSHVNEGLLWASLRFYNEIWSPNITVTLVGLNFQGEGQCGPIKACNSSIYK